MTITYDDIQMALAALSHEDYNHRGDRDLNGHLGHLFQHADAQAAVLIPLIERDGRIFVILTQRPQTMRQHAGQISFPGGREDPDDPDETYTALREAEEEIGLKPDRVEILGNLPLYETRTKYAVLPVVGKVDPTFEPVPNPEEVDAVIEVPLDVLMAPDACEIKERQFGEHRAFFYSFEYDGHQIWGATAGMIAGLRHVVGIENPPHISASRMSSHGCKK